MMDAKETPELTKVCLRCKTLKTLDAFSLDRSRKDGRHPYCKECLKGPPLLSSEARVARREKIRNRTEKTCNRCKEVKPIGQFVVATRNLDGHNTSCLECEAKQALQRFRNDPSVSERHQKRYRTKKQEILESIAKQREGRKLDLVLRLGGVCVDCGLAPNEIWPLAVFEFHHLDPSVKDSQISSLLANAHTNEAALEEARKCVVLCANCHRRRHYQIRWGT